MKVILNQNTVEVNSNNLEELLIEKDLINKKGIAIALNQSVVSKSNWSNTPLKENDNIMVITATQGG